MTHDPDQRLDRDRAISLIQGLVETSSLSGYELAASQWLAGRMEDLGLERCRVDEVHNAIGEIGDRSAGRTIVLLGHIDTVAGEIPVRIDDDNGTPTLWGRGAVDAKGPLATFTAAAARLGSEWARENDLRLVVVGAVEEESATSRGARHVRDTLFADRFPDACIIGEPSNWDRVTLGYKGRLLLDLKVSRAESHTAGPDPGIATAATTLWNAIDDYCQTFNASHERAFDQLLPSLRSLKTASDGLTESVRATVGIRLPTGFAPEPLVDTASRAVARRLNARTPPDAQRPPDGGENHLSIEGSQGSARLSWRGYEPAWRSPPAQPLVRGFLAAIRSVGPQGTQPRFVVKTGTSDMNVVAPVWQCPILAYGPGDSALDHTPVERLSLDEYWLAIRVLEESLRQIAAAPTIA